MHGRDFGIWKRMNDKSAPFGLLVGIPIHKNKIKISFMVVGWADVGWLGGGDGDHIQNTFFLSLIYFSFLDKKVTFYC